jgi:hypothetical protein
MRILADGIEEWNGRPRNRQEAGIRDVHGDKRKSGRDIASA